MAQLDAHFDIEVLTAKLQELKLRESFSAKTLSGSTLSEDLSASTITTVNPASPRSAPSAATEDPPSPLEDSHDSQVFVEQTASMQQSQAQPSSVVPLSKEEIWQDIKILSFCRLFTALYATALVALFTQAQLAVLGTQRGPSWCGPRSMHHAELRHLGHATIGRCAYRASVRHQAQTEQEHSSLESLSRMLFGEALDDSMKASQASETAGGETEAVNQATEFHFLALSWWVLHQGWKRVADQVHAAANIVFSESVFISTRQIGNCFSGTEVDVGPQHLEWISEALYRLKTCRKPFSKCATWSKEVLVQPPKGGSAWSI